MCAILCAKNVLFPILREEIAENWLLPCLYPIVNSGPAAENVGGHKLVTLTLNG